MIDVLKHCHCGCIYAEVDCPNCNYQSPANRIKELERERDEAMMTGHDLAKIEYRDLVSDLEDKLAKVVEIGNKMAKSIKGNYYIPNVAAEWDAALAELEGGE